MKYLVGLLFLVSSVGYSVDVHELINQEYRNNDQFQELARRLVDGESLDDLRENFPQFPIKRFEVTEATDPFKNLHPTIRYLPDSMPVGGNIPKGVHVMKKTCTTKTQCTTAQGVEVCTEMPQQCPDVVGGSCSTSTKICHRPLIKVCVPVETCTGTD